MIPENLYPFNKVTTPPSSPTSVTKRFARRYVAKLITLKEVKISDSSLLLTLLSSGEILSESL